jgi:NAD(P)H-dependent flavin oxidoreductase YrpB (nitropropane dioxygenase family)
MLATAFTRLVGCGAPIQLAGMPGVTSIELTAAVSNSGGLGMFGAAMLPAAELEAVCAELRRRTRGPFGITFLMPFLDRDCVPVAAAAANVVEFFYGEPDAEQVAAVHAGNALVSWQVGSLEEAVAAERAGCDFLIAQGTEAGGHVRGRIGLLPLLAAVLEAVRIPVLAAGGLATAGDVAAVLAAGAAGARIGTRFVAAAESDAHPRYVDALLAARGEDTVLTEKFGVMWPDAPHRVLRCAIEAAEAFAGEITGETPAGGGARVAIPRFAVVPPSRETTGAVDAMALYAGEGVGAVRRVQPAAEIVRELAEGAERLLRAC